MTTAAVAPTRTFWRFLKSAFLDALFPPRCLVCRRFSTPRASIKQQVAANKCFCEACQAGVKKVESPLCTACGVPFAGRQGADHLCRDCLEKPPQYGMARAAGIYADSLMQAIYRYKYGCKIELAKPLGCMLQAAFKNFWAPDAIDLVLPVPLNIRKQRQRGFNQSYLLVRDWSRPAVYQNGQEPGFKIDYGLITRIRHTAAQTGLSRSERRRNVNGAFAVDSKKKLTNRRILLVDDVYTTGATVNECARVLLKQGAARVDVLTLARAL
jgi:ComF family protein